MSISSNPRSPSSSSSSNEYPTLTSSELSRLLLNQEMNFAVANAFSSSPLSTVLLRHYLFLSHNLEWIRQDLLRHQQERESIFDVLSNSGPFQDLITPIVLNFRFQQRQVSPINPPSQFRNSSTSPSLEPTDERRTIIIQERSNSNESLLSFYTTRDEPGMQNNPIDVDSFLNPPPSPPRIPVYTPPRTRSAPITAPCSLCHQHGHTSIQCIWNGPGVCSYCEKVGHTVHNCNVLCWDRQRFDPHLLYCLTCKQSGHTSITCGTFLSHRWTTIKSGILGSYSGGNVTTFNSLSELFLLSLLSGCFCYLFLIFYDPEIFLFLLFFVDNGYADIV